MAQPLITTTERTETDIRPEVVPQEPGDHDRFAHYVPKDKLTEALVLGTPVQALCGKIWVPSRDPEKYPVCPECKEIKAMLDDLRSGGSGDG